MIIEYTKKHSDFSGFRFCALALSKETYDKRIHVTHIGIHPDNEVTGTDGSRLHLFRPETKYEPGFYRVFKNLPTMLTIVKAMDYDTTKYPGPYSEFFETGSREPDFEKAFSEREIDSSYCDIVLAMKGTGIFKHKFFQGLNGYFKVFLPTIKDNKYPPLILKNGKMEAIIMPMRM